MNRTLPTLAQIGDWGFEAVLYEEEKRAAAVQNLANSYHMQMKVISNLEAKVAGLEARVKHLESGRLTAVSGRLTGVK